MPRSRSSGALSIESKDRNLMFGLCFDSTLVIAAVKVVLPWSMCPIVPTFTCGLLRSNFSLAMIRSFMSSAAADSESLFVFPQRLRAGLSIFRPLRGRCTGEAPVPPKSLPSRPTLVLSDNLLGNMARCFFIAREVHRVFGAALGRRAHVGRVSEHLGER